MKSSHKFVQAEGCKYWMCHKGVESKDFSCKFCFCPLYPHRETNAVCQVCGPCEKCTFPHKASNYEKMVEMLTAYYALEQDKARKAEVIPKLKRLRMTKWDRKKKKWVSGFWTDK